MKKVLSQLKVQIAALLLVGGFMMMAGSAQAQSKVQPQPTNGVKIATTGTWADLPTATNLLNQEIASLNTALNQSSSDAEYLKYKMYFLELIQESIAGGVPLNKAVKLSFDKISGEIQPDSGTSSITQAQLDAMFQEVVDLLTL